MMPCTWEEINKCFLISLIAFNHFKRNKPKVLKRIIFVCSKQTLFLKKSTLFLNINAHEYV